MKCRASAIVLFILAGGAFFLSLQFESNNFLIKPASASSITARTQDGSPGVLSLIAGSLDGPGTADGDRLIAQFGDGQTRYGNRPVGITSDARGNLYVTDVSSHTIRKISPAGKVTTLAGKAGEPGNIDGTWAKARFNYPSGIAIDAKGTLYVADTANDLIRKISPSGVVTTLASLQRANGNGGKNTPPARVEMTFDANSTGGSYSTQDVRAQSPMGIAVDAKGQVYVAVTFNNTILKISPDGAVSTLAGQSRQTVGNMDGTGVNAWFNLPKGIAVDRAGMVYVADYGNDAIRKITPDGVVTTLVGRPMNEVVQVPIDGAAAVARMRHPAGVTVDGAGNLYVADEGFEMVRKISSEGMVSSVAGNYQRGAVDGIGKDAQFDAPTGVALDPAGNVYIADSRNAAIRKISVAGVVTTAAGRMRRGGVKDGVAAAAQFDSPYDLTADKQGNLYVADTGNSMIRKISPAGLVTTIAGTHKAVYTSDDGKATDYAGATGIAIDGAGYLYLVDMDNNVVRKRSPAGKITLLAGVPGPSSGSVDGPGPMARFKQPFRVALDSSGNLYIADNQTIRKIDSSGMVTTFAGKVEDLIGKSVDGTARNARFRSVGGITMDAAGNFYVTDQESIRKITPTGVVSTLAGRAGHPGNADGVGPNASFNAPGSPVIDAAGNLYVSDGDTTIRKITPEGVVTTVAGVAGKRGLMLGSPGLLDNPTGLTLIAPKTLALTSANAVLKLTLP
ncbi:NHL repeat-containing protein [Collimonas sp. PA-H2]|uniref:NHL domain-containing protein n=1 Tax=Collimonas sp. PA-H2 TaxID=1881062 RepID=UPI000BF84E6D|nr:hypothetical protein [Collimonas sp. PA-H2]PFH07680.1 NHL repeat-containing protein [Collimonas sp. PA-H2]